MSPLGGVSYSMSCEVRSRTCDHADRRGVTVESAADYTDAGAVAVGVSGALLETSCSAVT